MVGWNKKYVETILGSVKLQMALFLLFSHFIYKTINLENNWQINQ